MEAGERAAGTSPGTTVTRVNRGQSVFCNGHLCGFAYEGRKKGARLPRGFSNCSGGWQRWCSGDSEGAVDESADGIPGGLAFQAGGSGDGSVTGMDARSPG